MLCLEIIVTKFDVSSLLVSQVMDCQMHVIGKVIRFFTDPVTYTNETRHIKTF